MATFTKSDLTAEGYSVTREQVDDENNPGQFRIAIVAYLDVVIVTDEPNVIRRRKRIELIGGDKTKAKNFLQLLIDKAKVEEGGI